MLGNNPCTWGPSYWCFSKATAKKCGYVMLNAKLFIDGFNFNVIFFV